MKEAPQPVGLALRLERIALMATLFAVPLLGTTGFSRYEVLKRAALAVFGGIGLLAWILNFSQGRRARVLGGGFSAAALWLCLVFAALSILWAPHTSLALARLLVWICLGGVFVMVASRPREPDEVVLPLAASGVVTAVTVLLTRLDVALPPPTPTGMAPDAGAHGAFDHAAFAGVFLALLVPLCLYLAAVRGGWRRAVLLLAAVLMATAIGVTGAFPAILGGAALLLGALLSAGRLRGRAGSVAVAATALAALVAVAAGRFGIGEHPAEPPEHLFPGASQNVYDLFRVGGPENAVTSASEWGFEWDRGLTASGGQRALGRGAGSWPYYASLGVDPEHPYYTAERQEHYVHTTPPGLLPGLLHEQGVVGLLLWLGFFAAIGWSLARGLAEPAEPQRPGAGFLVAAALVAFVAALLTPAAYHAGEGVAVFAVFGLLVRLPADRGAPGVFDARLVAEARSGFARLERWVLVGAPLAVLLVVALVQEGRAVAVDFQRQRGELYLDARRHEEAIAELEQAAAVDGSDYLTQYYLGLAQYYTPADDDRRAASREHLRRATALWPHDVRVQMVALRANMNEGMGGLEERLGAASETRNQLQELLRRDPREIELYQQLADAHRALADYDEAATVLIDSLAVTTDDRQRAQTHYEIGRLFDEHISRPAEALEHYRQAAALAAPGSALARSVSERITFVEEWLERGERPVSEPGDDHEH